MYKKLKNISTQVEEYTPMIEGYKIDSRLYLLNSENSKNMFKVSLGAGADDIATFIVNADNEEDAVNTVTNFCEYNELPYAIDYYIIADLCDSGETIDNYIDNHGLKFSGDYGLYVVLKGVEEI